MEEPVALLQECVLILAGIGCDGPPAWAEFQRTVAKATDFKS